MDNYVEQIIVKKTDGKDLLKRFAIISVTMLLVVISLFCTVFIYPMLIFIGVGAVYVAWLMFAATSVEYEYIVTNNELDIDKIMGRRRRKRLITLKLSTSEAWGEYKEEQRLSANVTVAAHDCSLQNLWYILGTHEKHGRVLLLFTPADNVLFAVNKSMPYSLRSREITAREREEKSFSEPPARPWENVADVSGENAAETPAEIATEEQTEN